MSFSMFKEKLPPREVTGQVAWTFLNMEWLIAVWALVKDVWY